MVLVEHNPLDAPIFVFVLDDLVIIFAIDNLMHKESSKLNIFLI